MDTLLQDIRYATRKLIRTPGFTAIAVLTLALAVGANTAIFSVVNGVLLKPLPFKEPEQLLRVSTIGRRNNNDPGRMPSSALDFLDYQAQSKRVALMAAYTDANMNLTGGGDPQRLTVDRVSATFWTLLGVRPALGRGFLASEDSAGKGRVVVLSDAFWKKRFGGDRRVLGQSITLDGNPYIVVGVAPKGFTYPDRPDAWVPLAFSGDDLDPGNRGAHWLSAIGRLAPGATVQQANQELSTIAKRLEQQYPESNTGMGASALSLQEYTVGDVRPALLILLGAVGFVLLIACANVANLLLVRAASRETEMAVRTALGAGRGRIIRQLVTESVILSLVGGAAGALLAAWGVDLLVSLGPTELPRLQEVTVDGAVLGFTALVAAVTGVLFGLIPALHAARADINDMLKESARGSSARKGNQRVRGALVVAEMAMAVVLLAGAGLLIKSFAKLTAVDPGFKPERAVTFTVSLPDSKYNSFPPVRRFSDAMTERLKLLPGVTAAGAVLGLPMSNFNMRTSVHIEGTPQEAPADRKLTAVAIATPGYFAAIGIPLVRGRLFTDGDRLERPQVALVNREFVKRYFPNEDPIGKRITIGIGYSDSASFTGQRDGGGEIVGVVGDVRRAGLDAPVYPEVYVPHDQIPWGEMQFVVRTTADPAAVGAAARAQVRAIDPDLPVQNVRTMEELVDLSVSQPRFYMTLLAIFAGVAMVLAAVGIYGVVSYAVSQRTRELGIRIALGATRRQVLRLVLGQGFLMTVAGVVLGVVASLYMTRLIAGLLFGVTPMDPTTFIGVAVALIGVSLLASYLPARRAARVDPVITMRAE